MDLNKIKVDFKDPVTIATIVGSVLLLLASFLPIETAKSSAAGVTISTSRNLMGDYKHQGIFLLILAIACIVILILGLDREKILNAALGTTAAIGLWAIINGITGLNATKSDIKKYDFGGVESSTSFNIGFFALVLGVLAIGAAIVLISMNAKKSAPAQPAQPTQPMQ